MGLVTLHRQFNIAAPPLQVERDRRGHGLFAGSDASSQPREVRVRRLASRGFFFRWSRVLASLGRDQRMSFRGSLDTPSTRSPSEPRMLSLADHERMRAALGRTVAAVQATHTSSGEGAPNNGARGNHVHP